jgi:hypothetical protein
VSLVTRFATRMVLHLRVLGFCRLLDYPSVPQNDAIKGAGLDELAVCPRCGHTVVRDRSYSTGSPYWSHLRKEGVC